MVRPPQKKHLLLVLLILGIGLSMAGDASATVAANTDVVINEVYYLGNTAAEDWIELQNTGSTTIDVTTWWFCARFFYGQIVSMTLLDGADYVLDPGEIITLQSWINLNNSSSDLGLYSINNFASPASMVDFIQWGTAAAVGRSTVARDKGIWREIAPSVFDFIPTANAGESTQFDGSNEGGGLLTFASDFTNAPETRGTIAVEETTWGRVKAIYETR